MLSKTDPDCSNEVTRRAASNPGLGSMIARTGCEGRLHFRFVQFSEQKINGPHGPHGGPGGPRTQSFHVNRHPIPCFAATHVD